MRSTPRESKTVKHLLLLTMTLFIAGCVTAPKIYTNQDPDALFSSYNTYGFEPVLSTDKPGYSSILSKFLKNAASRELEQRGYTLSDNPDLTVNFFMKTKEKITETPGASFGGYYGYRAGHYGTWATYGGYGGYYGGRIRQQTEGTLTVDIVDSAGDQLVWEGSIIGIVSEDDQENLEESINVSIAEVFNRYPHRAGYEGMMEDPSN